MKTSRGIWESIKNWSEVILVMLGMTVGGAKILGLIPWNATAWFTALVLFGAGLFLFGKNYNQSYVGSPVELGNLLRERKKLFWRRNGVLGILLAVSYWVFAYLAWKEPNWSKEVFIPLTSGTFFLIGVILQNLHCIWRELDNKVETNVARIQRERTEKEITRRVQAEAEALAPKLAQELLANQRPPRVSRSPNGRPTLAGVR